MQAMISLIQPLAAGNALRVFLQPPAGAASWRLLRKVADTFAGEADPDALLVYEGSDNVTLDITGLTNGTLYYYRPYYLFDATWVAGPTATATPNATYQQLGADVLSLVRERLDLGLQEELRRGTLLHDQGHIKVLTAPPTFEDTVWPVVTVHLGSEGPAERAIGEMIEVDEFSADSWTEKEGWLARTQLNIMGWSENPDERIELRRALLRIVQANLPVFDFAGMVEIEFSQQDMEDFATFVVPVYQVLCTFSCLAPAQVGASVGAIKEVISTIEGN
jgi:hypothetical protein